MLPLFPFPPNQSMSQKMTSILSLFSCSGHFCGPTYQPSNSSIFLPLNFPRIPQGLEFFPQYYPSGCSSLWCSLSCPCLCIVPTQATPESSRAEDPEDLEALGKKQPHQTVITEARNYKRLSAFPIQLPPHSNKLRPRDLG